MNFKSILITIACMMICCQNLVFAQSSDNSNSVKTPETLLQPAYLKIGDTIAIVAPSGVLNNRTKEINQAKNLLQSWGLNVMIGANVYKQANHFAGTDYQRALDFQNALDNPNIKAIWCARGGYGTVRILDQLDYTEYKKNPKWIIGYSDITAIHNQLNNLGSESIHAMMCTSLTDDLSETDETVKTFKATLFGVAPSYKIQSSVYNKIGEASGPLVGGNLTLLHTMLGSKTSLNVSGNILFIEEIGEYKYHIDRMLYSLKRAGYFDNCKGLIVGDMSNIRKNTTPWGSSIEELILDVLKEYHFPILFNFPAGHEQDNRALILGRTIKLIVDEETSSVTFHN